MKEIPERRVEHGDDADDTGVFGDLVGEAQTLPMTQASKKKARERREKLDQLGGFGFRR